MGKHSKNPSDASDPLGNVDADTWTRILTAAVESPNSEGWARRALANAENARNN